MVIADTQDGFTDVCHEFPVTLSFLVFPVKALLIFGNMGEVLINISPTNMSYKILMNIFHSRPKHPSYVDM